MKDEGGKQRGKSISTFHGSSLYFQGLLLLVWVAAGTGLRFTQLDRKSPWTDEFSTMVFSLGNSFRTVPLDQAIPLNVLLEPLQPAFTNTGLITSVQNVIHHLLGESNHPPVYFILANLWMHLFPPAGEYVSLWVVRGLPALLGVLSIPAIYGFSRLAFRSRLIGQLSAAVMAISPYGIYLAQEARHYTLAILLVIASLSCLIIAVQCIDQHRSMPVWGAFIWVAVNSLGIAVHYFFSFTLCAEGTVLLALILHQNRKRTRIPEIDQENNLPPPFLPLKTLFAVAAGTLAGCLVWLPVWQSSSDDGGLTEWIYSGARVGLAWISPLFQALAAWVTMLLLLPVESPVLSVAVVSGAVMLIFIFWASPILWRGFKNQLTTPANRTVTAVLAGLVLSVIALFFIITYGFGIDLTRGARYHFVYFPAVIALLGVSLAACWETSQPRNGEKGEIRQSSIPISFSWRSLASFKIFAGGKIAVVLILLVGFLSGLTVAINLGYQKYYRPDLLVPIIQQAYQTKRETTISKGKSDTKTVVLIATTHQNHVQTGEMMGLAWELKRLADLNSQANIQFLLAHQKKPDCKGEMCLAAKTLQKTLKTFSSADLWLVNFKVPANLNPQNCTLDARKLPPVDGYNYQLYHCRSTKV
ncbi:glycosyltransferase family 39 protein [Microcoleus sp. FACHB-672]|uniref:glycosyltransferase family 39 protein n=1 Tax=Microcoleus sp. FACHB-672 TaxID=2692825 RepID=UPI001682744F|nr:glycosyltransferase family 39 protein [Microcoleus sp. FACHB-672]MBD2040802.1 glycosyltransferase family 39 protein [Microcoleus sp. FACHB-672]